MLLRYTPPDCSSGLRTWSGLYEKPYWIRAGTRGMCVVPRPSLDFHKDVISSIGAITLSRPIRLPHYKPCLQMPRLDSCRGAFADCQLNCRPALVHSRYIAARHAAWSGISLDQLGREQIIQRRLSWRASLLLFLARTCSCPSTCIPHDGRPPLLMPVMIKVLSYLIHVRLSFNRPNASCYGRP